MRQQHIERMAGARLTVSGVRAHVGWRLEKEDEKLKLLAKEKTHLVTRFLYNDSQQIDYTK